MKKICIACVSGLPIPPVRGGAVEALVQQIVEENEKNPHYQIVVLTIEDEKAKKLSKGYKYTQYVRFRPNLLFNRILFRVAKIKKQFGKKQAYYVSSEKIKSAKYLMKNHGIFDLIIDEGGIEEFVYGNDIIPFKKRVLHMHGIDKYCVDHATAVHSVFCVSHFCSEQWIEMTSMDRKDVYDLINSINTETLRRKPSILEIEQLKKFYDISDDTFVLLYAGRLIEEKGLSELIEAVNLIDDKRLLLLVLGGVFFSSNSRDTDYVRHCKEIANTSSSRVLFLGYIDNNELYKYHSLTDIAVIPSRYDEPACLVVLEAQGAGDAVIATDSGGTPELLGNGCGILVRNDKRVVNNLKEAILKLWNDPALCQKCGEAGIEYSLKNNGASYFSRFCNLTDRLLIENDKLDV